MFTDFFHHHTLTHTHAHSQTSAYNGERSPPAYEPEVLFYLLTIFSKRPASRGELDHWCTAREKTKHSLTEVSHAGKERRDAQKYKTHISTKKKKIIFLGGGGHFSVADTHLRSCLYLNKVASCFGLYETSSTF